MSSDLYGVADQARRYLIAEGICRFPDSAGSLPACWADAKFVRDPKDQDQGPIAVYIEELPPRGEDIPYFSLSYNRPRINVTIWAGDFVDGYNLCADVIAQWTSRVGPFELHDLHVEYGRRLSGPTKWTTGNPEDDYRWDITFEFGVRRSNQLRS